MKLPPPESPPPVPENDADRTDPIDPAAVAPPSVAGELAAKLVPEVDESVEEKSSGRRRRTKRLPRKTVRNSLILVSQFSSRRPDLVGVPEEPRPVVEKAKGVSRGRHRRRRRSPRANVRLNKKALVKLLVGLLLLPILYFGITAAQDGWVRRQALEQARAQSEAGKIDQAIAGLDNFLTIWPDDIPGLELMANLRTEGARSLDELIAAAEAQDRLLRLDPKGTDRQENRRKLVSLYVRSSEGIRQGATARASSVDRTENRSRSAVKVAEQIIKYGDDGSEAHRLLAMALECQAATGDASALPAAIIEYENALTRDPADVVSAERLATIIQGREGKTTGGDEILDDLLKAASDSSQVRLARYRFFARTGRISRAQDELKQATAIDPSNPDVRLTAASEAIKRRDPASARRYLQAISNDSGNDRRVKRLLGFVELLEQGKADGAIDTWRVGLMDSGGTDRDLTWRLACTLIQVGRLTEAEPVIDQYRRLSGDDDLMLQLLLGMRDEVSGRPGAAIQKLEKLGAWIQKDWLPELATILGRALEKINDEPRAMLEYRRAIKSRPQSLEAWRSLARLIKRSDPEVAIREIKAALIVMPDEPSLLLDLVMIPLERQLARPAGERDWSKVKEALDRAEQAPGPDPRLNLARADMLASTGRFDEAMTLMGKVLEGPNRSRIDLWLYLADALAIRGRIGEALKVLDRGSAPSNAGDHASIRIARSVLLLRSGQGRAARELISRNADTLPIAEQVELARARVGTLHNLGNRVEARRACLEWAKLSPMEPQPGIVLLEMARKDGDEESVRLGLEILNKCQSEDEPNALAARALQLLYSNRKVDGTRTARLDKADELSQKLLVRAPRMPIARLVRGMVLERNHRLDEAIVDYQVALESSETAEMALAQLIDLYARLKQYDDLAKLKVKSPITVEQLAARLAIEQGDLTTGERLTARLTEQHPDDPDAYVIQARLLRQLGKPLMAERALASAIDRDKKRSESWISLVEFQAGRGATAEAALTIDRAGTEYKGERPDLLVARLRWVAGNRETAAKLYEEAISRHPEDLPTYQAALAFAEAVGLTDRAESLARRAIRVPSCSAWAARSLATVLSKRRDGSGWSEAWSLVGPGGPGWGEAPGDRLLRASILTLNPDPARRAEATALLSALTEDLPASDPIGLRSRINLATVLMEAGRLAEAARPIAEATENSTDPSDLQLAVEILARTGQVDEADRRLSKLATVEPEPFLVACSRSWVFLARGKPNEAVLTIEDAASAVEKTPNATAALTRCFQQLLAIQKPEAAERMARRMEQLEPKNGWLLADFLGSRGRVDEALEAAQSSVRAGATLEPLKVAFGLAMAGSLSWSQNDLARTIAKTALANRPDDPDLIRLTVTLANHQGRPDDAMAICLRAFEAKPSDPFSRMMLNDMAWIFSEDLGRPADALSPIDRVLKVDPSASAMDTRGVILTRLNRLDEAINQLELCLRKEPVGHRYLHLARAYQKAGKLEQYQGALTRARELGVNPAALGPKEREEFAAAIQ